MTDKETNEVMNSGDLWETEAKTNPCHERWNARQLYILCVGCEQQEWMGKDLLGSLKRTQDLGSDPNNEGKDSHSWMYKESKKVSEETRPQN